MSAEVATITRMGADQRYEVNDPVGQCLGTALDVGQMTITAMVYPDKDDCSACVFNNACSSSLEKKSKKKV